MTARPFLIATLAVTFAHALPLQAETPADRFQPQRGLSFEIWNEWLTADEMVTRPGFLDVYPDWRRIVPLDRIVDLKAKGFDFVRLPFDPAPLLRLGPGARQDGLIDQIFVAASLVKSTGLKVIVDLHSIPRPGEDWGTDTIVGDPALFDAHVALVGKVAARLNGLDADRVALELLNEPTGDCDTIWQNAGTELWPDQLKRLHAAARTGAPDLPLILSGACWGGVDGLERIDPATIADDNVIFSFHSYDPFLFTHQSASWTNGPQAYFADVPFPPESLDDARAAQLVAKALTRAQDAGAAIDEAALAAALSDYRREGSAILTAEPRRAAAWADAHGIPRNRLILGEFGAMREDMQGRRFSSTDRDTFLAAKRKAAEDLGIGWSVWVWSGTFGVVDDDARRTFLPGTCNSLGLAGC